MIRFFSYLGIDEEKQNTLPNDLIQGGQIIDGMQLIYEQMPNGYKKDKFALMIAETSSVVLAKLNRIRLGSDIDSKVEEELKEVEEIEEVEQPIEIEETIEIEEPKEIELPSGEKKVFLQHILKDLENLDF